MYDEGGLVRRRLMIPEGTKQPHEENGLGLGRGVGLSYCITVESRGPGDMITGVKQCEGHAVDACVDCVLQGREPSTGVERNIDMMGSLVRGGRREAGFWRRKMGERAHTANIKRREIRHRPVDIYRARKRSEGVEGAGNLPPPGSRTTRGGDKCMKGSPSISCTEDLWKPVLRGHRAMVHERTGRSPKNRSLRRRNIRM